MEKFERSLYKTPHPFDIDGYWWFWTDTKGDRWSLKTVCWTGKQPKEFKSFDLPRYHNENDIKNLVDSHNSFKTSPYIRYFFHLIKKQAVQLRNITKGNEWLKEQKEKNGKV